MVYPYNSANNNSLWSPSNVLKLSIVAFLVIQAIRQLLLVNHQYDNKQETRAGQVATWMTILLTLIVAAYLSQGGVTDRKTVLGVLFLVFVGVMGSGISMLYATFNVDKDIKDISEPRTLRQGFAAGHIFFATLLLIFLMYHAWP